ncbi:MAG: hypothetical protein WKG07_26795 [Hymenobacter sp.]
MYKMPGESAAAPPLRTRPPAGNRERHYQQRVPRRQARFNRRDFWLVSGLVGLIFLFGISGQNRDGPRAELASTWPMHATAFARGQWRRS